MKYVLPLLPYAYDALEPFIDARTMELHHTKHHQVYIDKLNAALDKYPEIADRPLEELLKDLNSVPEDIRTAVRNHGGGHYNHSVFWTIMMPPERPLEPGIFEKRFPNSLLLKIHNEAGGQEKFQKDFTEIALNHFGSGWTWLVVKNEKLSIVSTTNQDTPLSEGAMPLLGLDLWEHAYYLKYQNRRAEYIEAWWNVVNWDEVARRSERKY